MKKLTYPKAVGDVLENAGFVKVEKDRWRREIGDYVDQIVIYLSRDFKEIAVDIHVEDRITQDIICEATTDPLWMSRLPIDIPLPWLDGKGNWWPRGDPEGPSKLAQAVRLWALPFLQGLHSLEGMRAYLEKAAPNRWYKEARLSLAVTLSRLGDHDKALEILNDSMPMAWRRTPHFQRVENLKQWVIERRKAGGGP